ncbi:MAG: hypothetical protein KAI97_02145, partial [Gemmatimonadetes bacterium]|nr:hypothetical protein [Gemmatimonadota bacterium]
GIRTRTAIQREDFKSHKYFYNQQLTSTTNNNPPHLTTPKSRPLNGLPESRFCWQLLLVAVVD